jgi:hypothetical protein
MELYPLALLSSSGLDNVVDNVTLSHAGAKQSDGVQLGSLGSNTTTDTTGSMAAKQIDPMTKSVVIAVNPLILLTRILYLLKEF